MPERRRRWLDRVPRRERSPARELEPGVPVVPFVPVRCPRCRELAELEAASVVGRAGGKLLREHECGACGLTFRSREVDPAGDR